MSIPNNIIDLVYVDGTRNFHVLDEFKTKKPDEYYKICATLFDTCKEEAAKRVLDVIDNPNSEHTPAELTRVLSMDFGAYYSHLKYEHRPFSFRVDNLVKFCHTILNTSCHELLFGEPAYVRLPKLDALLVDAFITMSDDDRSHIINIMGTLQGERDTTGMTITERINQLANDIGTVPRLIIGKRPYSIARLAFLTGNDEKRMANINLFMYLSVYHDTAVDYFVSTDYTICTNLCMPDGTVLQDDDDAKARLFLGKYLTLPKEKRIYLAAEVLRYTL